MSKSKHISSSLASKKQGSSNFNYFHILKPYTKPELTYLNYKNNKETNHINISLNNSKKGSLSVESTRNHSKYDKTTRLNSRPSLPSDYSLTFRLKELTKSPFESKKYSKMEKKNIENKENKNNNDRKIEIDYFIKKLSETKKFTMETNKTLSERKNKLKYFYEAELTKISDLFSEIISIIVSNKSFLLDKIRNSLSEMEKTFDKHAQTLEKNIKDLENISFDIQTNISDILNNMETNPFKQIMEKYTSKLISYRKIYEEIGKESLIITKLNFYFNNTTRNLRFNDEIWGIFRPYLSINRFSVPLIENNNILTMENDFQSPTKKIKIDNCFSFKGRDVIEDSTIKIRESMNSPQTQKYLDLLNKVNHNQETNYSFFNNMKSAVLSPKN